MKLITKNLTKETLVYIIQLNEGILSEIERNKIAQDNLFMRETQSFKRLNRYSETYQNIISDCVNEILNILEEESL